MAPLSPEVVEERVRRYGKLWTIDDLIRTRAKDEEQTQILFYPKGQTADQYEGFTGKELDRMVDEACRAFVARGLEVNSHKPVALYAQSDLSYAISFFALFRLGCKVVTLSIRLGSKAALNLMDHVQCNTIFHGTTARIKSTLDEIRKTRPDIVMLPMLKREDFDHLDSPSAPFTRHIEDKEKEHTDVALIMHSSGSTGLPKPLLCSHRSLTTSLVSGPGLKATNVLPWYHFHGLMSGLQAMWMRKPAYMFNANLPLTADNLISALKAIQPEICYTVPYVLKLIAERQDGVEILKRCKAVTSAGARLPDELGDRLVHEGVKLGMLFGLTEVGHVGDSIGREPGDDSWAYMRPYANVLPHMLFKKMQGDAYECIYLKSHPALMISNSNDPPGSYYSKDIFTPHPTIPNAWKYIGRDDDRITLLSGEKILPLAIEGLVRDHPLVRDVAMVGSERLVPGLLVFRSAHAAALSDAEFVKAIWPAVEAGNKIADEFARITPDMILPIAAEVDFPATDKGSMIRAQTYVRFEDDIENLYKEREGQTNGTHNSVQNGNGIQALKLDLDALEKYIMQLCQESGIELPDSDADFFAAGIDSLRASQIRRLLQRGLDLGGHNLPTNVLYDAGNVRKLARVLSDMRRSRTNGHMNGHINGHANGVSDIVAMEKLVHEYGKFQVRKPGELPIPDKDVVVLTGATGALGAHILFQLLSDFTVSSIFCLVRGDNPLERLRESLRSKGLSIKAHAAKLTVLQTDDLSAPHLGLSLGQFSTLANTATLIIHAAWPVNFNLALSSFVPHIAGYRALLDLASSGPFATPARVLFASSISTAFGVPKPGPVAEGPIERLDYAAPTGYARSKLVVERIGEYAAASGAAVGVLRIGQICGDTRNGIWNRQEAIPLMIQSARELRTLPRLDGDLGRCEWAPVDVVASACLQLARKVEAGKSAAFWNVVSPHQFSWNEDLLPVLRKAGLEFEDVAFEKWLERLREKGEELGFGAETRLPAYKLAEYYGETYGEERDGAVSGIGVRFKCEKTCQDSEFGRTCPEVLEAGLVPKMLRFWLGGDGEREYLN